MDEHPGKHDPGSHGLAGKMPGKMVVISGPSGSGKSTICKRLLSDPRIVFSVSATTRKMRPGEVDGRDYHFITVDEFRKRIARGEFIEHAEVFGNMYGTLREPMRRALQAGQMYLLEIDVQGALQVRYQYPDALMLFILPPNEHTLLQRLNDRGRDDADDISKRFRAAKREIHMAKGSRAFEFMVVNDTIERAVDDVSKIIKHKRSEASE